MPAPVATNWSEVNHTINLSPRFELAREPAMTNLTAWLTAFRFLSDGMALMRRVRRGRLRRVVRVPA